MLEDLLYALDLNCYNDCRPTISYHYFYVFMLMLTSCGKDPKKINPIETDDNVQKSEEYNSTSEPMPSFSDNNSYTPEDIEPDKKSEPASIAATVPDIDNKSAEKAYMKIIDAYKEACAENSEDWLSNPEKYLSKYPNVNEYIMEMYHTPSHYDEELDSDEPYELCYMFYDIDSNGISELLLSVKHHESTIFAVYTFNGQEALELGLTHPEEYGSYNIYTNNVIAAYHDDVDYYRLRDDGFSTEKISVSFEEMDSLLKCQLITSQEDWAYLGKDVAVSFNVPQTEEPPHLYSDEELIELARNYYATLYDSGYIPQYIEVDSTDGDMVMIHLYDVVQLHTATADWYTVSRIDATGTNILGEYIDLKNP